MNISLQNIKFKAEREKIEAANWDNEFFIFEGFSMVDIYGLKRLIKWLLFFVIKSDSNLYVY